MRIRTQARHATTKLYHIAKIIKENHPHANITVKDKNIYVNNNKRKPAVIPPTMEQTLTTDQNEIDIMNNVSFYVSDLIGMKGSTFRAIASPACSAEDARYAYLAVSRFPGVASSSHLISAYYTLNEEFDYEDDGDHGLGRHVFEILQEKGLKGVIVFLSRDFGGIHLGKDRFTIINKVVAQSLGRYNAVLQRNPDIQHPARLHVFTTAPPPTQQPIPQNDLQAASSSQPAVKGIPDASANTTQPSSPAGAEGLVSTNDDKATPDKQDKDDSANSKVNENMEVDVQVVGLGRVHIRTHLAGW